MASDLSRSGGGLAGCHLPLSKSVESLNSLIARSPSATALKDLVAKDEKRARAFAGTTWLLGCITFLATANVMVHQVYCPHWLVWPVVSRRLGLPTVPTTPQPPVAAAFTRQWGARARRPKGEPPAWVQRTSKWWENYQRQWVQSVECFTAAAAGEPPLRCALHTWLPPREGAFTHRRLLDEGGTDEPVGYSRDAEIGRSINGAAARFSEAAPAGAPEDVADAPVLALPFMTAVDAMGPLFVKLPGFSVFRKDILGNAEKLSRNGAREGGSALTLQALCERDFVAGRESSDESSPVALIWLARVMNFTVHFIEEATTPISDGGAQRMKPMAECVQTAYDRALRPHHNMILVGVSSAVLRLVGDDTAGTLGLLQSDMAPGSQLVSDLKNLAHVAAISVDRIDKYMHRHGFTDS